MFLFVCLFVCLLLCVGFVRFFGGFYLIDVVGFFVFFGGGFKVYIYTSCAKRTKEKTHAIRLSNHYTR